MVTHYNVKETALRFASFESDMKQSQYEMFSFFLYKLRSLRVKRHITSVYHSPSVSCFTEPFLVSASYFSLSLVFSCCLVVWFLTFCLVYWINPLPSIWTLFTPAWTIACVPGLPLLSICLFFIYSIIQKNLLCVLC